MAREKTYKGKLDLEKNAKKITKTCKMNRYAVSGDGIAGEIFLLNDIVKKGDKVTLTVN